MKRQLALLLAAAMLLTMTACGGSVEPANTTPVATASSEPVIKETSAVPAPEMPTAAPQETPVLIPSSAVSVEELLLSEDTKTISGKSFTDCAKLLQNLGFIELTDTKFSKDMCTPCKLSYNSKAFKMEFEFNLHGDPLNPCTIYGAKAEGLLNISGAAFDECDNFFDSPVWIPTDKVSHLDICPQYAGYYLANFGSAEDAWPLHDWGLDKWYWGIDDPSAMVTDIARYSAIYSPGTGNTYNIFSSYIEPYNYSFMDYHTSAFLRQPGEIVRRVWENTDLKKVQLRHPDDISFEGEGMEDFIYFEKGMTFSEWCNSQYNLDNWKFIDHGGYGEIRSQNDQYYLLVGYTLKDDGTVEESRMDILVEEGFQTAVSINRVA